MCLPHCRSAGGRAPEWRCRRAIRGNGPLPLISLTVWIGHVRPAARMASGAGTSLASVTEPLSRLALRQRSRRPCGPRVALDVSCGWSITDTELGPTSAYGPRAIVVDTGWIACNRTRPRQSRSSQPHGSDGLPSASRPNRNRSWRPCCFEEHLEPACPRQPVDQRGGLLLGVRPPQVVQQLGHAVRGVEGDVGGGAVGQRGGLLLGARLPQAVQQDGHAARVVEGDVGSGIAVGQRGGLLLRSTSRRSGD